MCYFLEVPPWVQIFSQYEGLCMVGLTFIYLVTSIFFVLSAYRSTQTAENVLKEMRRQRKEENRPYVHFDIQMDPNRMALFVLNNSGRTLAKKLQVRFHQTLWIYKNFKEMEEEQRENREAFTPCMTHPVDFLAPGKTFTEFVGSFPLLYHATDERLISGELTYYDTEDHCYVQTFEISLESIGKGYVLSKASQYASDLDYLAKFMDDTFTPLIRAANTACERLERKGCT